LDIDKRESLMNGLSRGEKRRRGGGRRRGDCDGRREEEGMKRLDSGDRDEHFTSDLHRERESSTAVTFLERESSTAQEVTKT
jgi:hypothetical protein